MKHGAWYLEYEYTSMLGGGLLGEKEQVRVRLKVTNKDDAIAKAQEKWRKLIAEVNRR